MVELELIPIKERLEENEEFLKNPLCRDSIYLSIDFFRKVGFVHPWIGYYVKRNGDLVGSAAFKGRPVNGIVEIAYGTFEQYRNGGIGTGICKQLVDLSWKTDPSVKITARTLPFESYSTRILQKNNFIFIGMADDPDDGKVWEWLYKVKE